MPQLVQKSFPEIKPLRASETSAPTGGKRGFFSLLVPASASSCWRAFPSGAPAEQAPRPRALVTAAGDEEEEEGEELRAGREAALKPAQASSHRPCLAVLLGSWAPGRASGPLRVGRRDSCAGSHSLRLSLGLGEGRDQHLLLRHACPPCPAVGPWLPAGPWAQDGRTLGPPAWRAWGLRWLRSDRQVCLSGEPCG